MTVIKKKIYRGDEKTIILDEKDEPFYESYVWLITEVYMGFFTLFRINSDPLRKEKGELRTIRFHRTVMNAKFDERVVHLNKNGLDFRHKNLKIVKIKRKK